LKNNRIPKSKSGELVIVSKSNFEAYAAMPPHMNHQSRASVYQHPHSTDNIPLSQTRGWAILNARHARSPSPKQPRKRFQGSSVGPELAYRIRHRGRTSRGPDSTDVIMHVSARMSYECPSAMERRDESAFGKHGQPERLARQCDRYQIRIGLCRIRRFGRCACMN
jgi:hypothetical protein